MILLQQIRQIFLMQKLQVVMSSLVSSIENVEVDKITVLPNNSSSTASKSATLVEEVKATTGVDIPAVVKGYFSGT